MADDQQAYSNEEFALILRKAAELTNRAEQPGLLSGGLTLREMKTAAEQAGLDPALVERAARLLVDHAIASPFERLIGGPLRHEHDTQFPILLDEGSAARLLSAVRVSATDYGSPTTGHSSPLGVTWDASGAGDVLRVVARPDLDGTNLSAVLDRRGTLVLTGVISSVAVLASCIAGIGLHEAAPVLSVGIAVAGVSATMLGARRFWVSSTRKARERLAGLIDAIGQALAQPEQRAALVRDEARPGNPQ